MDWIKDHVTSALDRLPIQFRLVRRSDATLRDTTPASYLKRLIEEHIVPLQELEDILWGILEGWYLANAVGVQLDEIGNLVGLSRGAWTDDDYRKFIGAAILRNASKGEPWRLIKIVEILTGATDVRFDEYYPAAIVITYIGTAPYDDAVFGAFVKTAVAAGVRLNIIEQAQPEPFVFFDDPDGLGFSGLTAEPVLIDEDCVDLSDWTMTPGGCFTSQDDPVTGPGNKVALSGVSGAMYQTFTAISTSSTITLSFGFGHSGAVDVTGGDVHLIGPGILDVFYFDFKPTVGIRVNDGGVLTVISALTTGVNHTADVAIDQGAGTFTVSLDGAAASGPYTVPNSIAVTSAWFQGRGTDRVWYDDIVLDSGTGNPVSDNTGGAFSRLVL